MEKNIKNGLVEFVKQDDGTWIPYEKIFAPLEGEEKTKKYTTWIDETNDGAKGIKDLFGSTVFDYPKSPNLLVRFLKMAGVESGDIILDFFSGSATTAHAVMQLNAEDGGHRISYNTIEGEYDSSIFTAEKATQSFDKAFLAKKAIQDYVFTDGSAEKSIERKFAEDLDAAEEVCVYAKLPRTFQIPTPVGNYSPDWAIAFYAGTVKHIFFVAETKGTMETLELRPIEQAKISCAKKLFNEMSTSHVVYHDVDSYQSLLNIMNSI